MDFLGGALPNVMFIVGVLAIGLGLGIELKLVPLNKEIDKIGRIGAILLGAILVASSLFIYLNPSFANRPQVNPTPVSNVQLPLVAPTRAIVATAILIPPATSATQLPSVSVPDIHDLSEKDAQELLKRVGLEVQEVETCSGADAGNPKAKKNHIQCQNPAANAVVPFGSTVEYVLK